LKKKSISTIPATPQLTPTKRQSPSTPYPIDLLLSQGTQENEKQISFLRKGLQFSELIVLKKKKKKICIVSSFL